MEVALIVKDPFMQNMMKRLGVTDQREVARMGLSLLNWATEVVARGNYIVEMNPNGTALERLAQPTLESIRLAVSTVAPSTTAPLGEKGIAQVGDSSEGEAGGPIRL